MSEIIYAKRRTFIQTTFQNNTTIKTIDLKDSMFDWYDENEKIYYYNDMAEAFSSCTNLESVININPLTYNLCSTFYNCSKLNYIDKLPPNATLLNDTFNGCSALTTAPKLPSTAQEIGGMFLGTGITTAPVIPESCIWMKKTFYNCPDLGGDIIIYSSNIESAEDCFTNSQDLPKGVWIPFRDKNGNYTTTYNSFIDAGYDENGTKDYVWLMDIKDLDPQQRVWVEEYNYARRKGKVVLTKYNGNCEYISTPNIEEG